LAFAAVTALVTGILFGLPSALRLSRPSVANTLRDTLATVSTRGRLHAGLVVAEIALALCLFVSGALLMRSFVSLTRVDNGYDAEHVLTFQVAAQPDGYSPDRLRTFADDLVVRIRSLPGVAAAGYGRQLPMVQLRDSQSFGVRPSDTSTALLPTDARYVSPGYLQAIGARLVAGRWAANRGEIVVSRSLAEREYPDGGAVGRVAFLGRDPTPRLIAGIIEDQHLFGLDRDPVPQFVADLDLWSGPAFTRLPLGAYYVVRTTGDSNQTAQVIARLVRQTAPNTPMYNVAMLDQIIANSITLPRMYAVLLSTFAALAVALAAVGIYGVVAFSVSQRTREIGIRMALGARRTQVLRLVTRQSAALTIIGITIGLVIAAGITRYLESMLFGVTALDPMTFAGATILFAAVAMLAAALPARRAVSVDPCVALRSE